MESTKLRQFYAEELEVGVLAFGETPAGRGWAGLRRALFALVVGAVALMVILAPDLVMGVGAHKPKLFIMSLILVSAVMGVALAMSRIGRRERWVLDIKSRAMVLERAAFGRELEPEVLELGFVRELVLHTRAVPQASAIEAILAHDDGPPVTMTLIEGWRMDDSIVEVFDALERQAKKCRLRVTFRRA